MGPYVAIPEETCKEAANGTAKMFQQKIMDANRLLTDLGVEFTSPWVRKEFGVQNSAGVCDKKYVKDKHREKEGENSLNRFSIIARLLSVGEKINVLFI